MPGRPTPDWDPPQPLEQVSPRTLYVLAASGALITLLEGVDRGWPVTVVPGMCAMYCAVLARRRGNGPVARPRQWVRSFTDTTILGAVFLGFGIYQLTAGHPSAVVFVAIGALALLADILVVVALVKRRRGTLDPRRTNSVSAPTTEEDP